MSALAVAQRYFDAWNQHEAGLLVATFDPGGTYRDPATRGPLLGPAIGAYANSLFAAFPDLSFDLAAAPVADADCVTAQWVMRGTNTGPFGGGPPTGRTIAFPGADFIRVRDGHVASVEGYFDQRAFVEQLGLQVIVRPYQLGPVTFGSSVHMASGNPARPGAFSITWIDVRSEAEADQVEGDTRAIMPELARMEGFVALLATRIGRRLCTITAWEGPDHARQLLHAPTHRAAMERFFQKGFAQAGRTSVYVPHRADHVWTRCGTCGAMLDRAEELINCRCGHAVAARPPMW
ncbi:MAG: ester cyclase [Bacillati bacterium ANGP1]|uniref:Ester cyclase n=1 Tax=Candidatus Segetimicrobium genomatis TaxID=2569760 RepID=A0A537J1H7_9BACT|nr:MAG: ester cyclase [Terrabacteria group bacterium ANGP1]